MVTQLNKQYLILKDIISEQSLSNSTVNISESKDAIYSILEQSINSVNNEKYLKFVEHLNAVMRDHPQLDGSLEYNLRPLNQYSKELLDVCKNSYTSSIAHSFLNVDHIYQVTINMNINYIYEFMELLVKFNKHGYR